MTLKELLENEELLAACAKEAGERIGKGENPEQVKLDVFRAHGAEVDEDALKAAQVEKMPMSDVELESVSGGGEVIWCDRDNNCEYVYHHKGGHGEWCFWSYECGYAVHCDVGLSYSRPNN